MMIIRVLSLIVISMVVTITAVRANGDAISPHAIVENDINARRHQLRSSYDSGASGIKDVIKSLDTALKFPSGAVNIDTIDLAVYYLSRYIADGYKTPDIGCALVRAIKHQLVMRSTLQTADALKNLTGIDVGYDESFVNLYDSSEEYIELRNSKIRKWESALKCSTLSD